MLFALALVAGACGSDGDDTSSGDGSGGGASGDIFVSGSSTVEPISIRVAEEFAKANSDVNIAVEGPGTGDGFKKFCTGETDVSDASRQIKDSEAEDCATNGVNWVELKVGIDGIAAMSGPGNPIDCLSFADMYSITSPEATGFTNWSDANELNLEVGGAGDLPDAPLTITAPGEESGTFASFIEIVLEDLLEERGQDITTRPDYQSSADDNVIINNISSDDTSFGWVGFAFAEEAGDSVKVFSVSEEPGGECISPTPETIADNTYPISRDLYIYVNTGKAAENEALVDFVDFYMDYGLKTATPDAKYVPLDDAAMAETVAAWNNR
ncbi:MAG: substrate-binding domain-containing protein [Acidimicrobiales bacterium]